MVGKKRAQKNKSERKKMFCPHFGVMGIPEI
jgi:hypothetical protein